MMQVQMIGRVCVEAKDETANAWSREEVQGTRYLDGSSNKLCARLEWGWQMDSQATTRPGWTKRDYTVVWDGRGGAKGVELSTIVSGSGGVGGQRRRRGPRCARTGGRWERRCEKERRNGRRIGSRAG
ncbi:hypothetical protein B0H65DRAFT_263513 [Neurospora tetraspora]|uniref:Uncharacterized protein n=1 Tax=Neurospora tetraspora TaxID=94610 RepID=A0AAE0JAV3_9PEZI|nr:hypothetical protein B0H65DRAFT_263513 [Neurospora tetraspora]